jgi:tetratricopeptide (TPR) repeat protein
MISFFTKIQITSLLIFVLISPLLVDGAESVDKALQILELAANEAAAMEADSAKIVILNEIASAQLKGGDHKAAKETSMRAAQVARTIPAGGREALYFVTIAMDLFAAGDLEVATGLLREGLQRAQKITGETWLFVPLATAFARIGEEKLAFQIVDGMDTSGDEYQNKLSALRNIASIQKRKGDFIALAKTIEQQLRLLDQILQRAEIGKDEAKRDALLGEISLTQALAGDIQGALAMAEAIQDRTKKKDALNFLGTTLSERGNTVNEAIESENHTEDPEKRSYAFQDIAKKQVTLGDLDAAAVSLQESYRSALMMDGPIRLKVFALNKIAIAFGEIGNKEKARNVLLEALKITLEMKDIFEQGDLLQKITQAQAQMGAFEEAIQTIAAINDTPANQTWIEFAWGDIALAYSKRGAMKEAFSAVERIPKDRLWRVETLGNIGTIQAKDRDSSTALEWAMQQPSPSSRARVLLGIAKGLLERARVEAE